MRIKSSSFRFVCILILGSFMTTGCLKHEFTEPPDPFEQQRLEEGYATFEFGSGENKVTILTNKDNVTPTDKGNIRIRGTIFAGRNSLIPVRIGQGDYILVKHLTGGQKTVYLNGHGDIPLSKGSFKMLKNNHSGFESFEGFGGYSEFTLPKVGITQYLEIPTADGSPTGFALGSELEDFPVNPDRYYFYFYYGDQADFVLSQSSFMVDKMALDPDDPYFYVHASALSIPVLDAVEDGGFAVSVQGMIPFDVPSSLSFGKVESFNFGNIMLQASINLESVLEVPLVIQDATTVIGFGNLTDGVNFFNDMQVPMTIGIYGSFVVDIGGIVEWQVGEAAVSLRYGGPNDFKFSYAGVFDNDMSILSAIEDLTGIKADVSAFDFIQPPQQVMKIVAYGSIGSNINDWEVGMKSQSYMEFPHIMTIDLGGVDFEINPDHLYYNCRMPIAIFGHIGLAGEINKNGSFWLKAYSHAGVSY
ncbi:MAG: hypothetical protein J7L89_06555, partial [Bacteroidales bacterium]|nr:hypothetical protein [Bacteroidales bacterium]